VLDDGDETLRSWALDVTEAEEADVDTTMYLEYALNEAGLTSLQGGRAPPMRPVAAKAQGGSVRYEEPEVLTLGSAAEVVVDEIWVRPKHVEQTPQDEACVVM